MNQESPGFSRGEQVKTTFREMEQGVHEIKHPDGRELWMLPPASPGDVYSLWTWAGEDHILACEPDDVVVTDDLAVVMEVIERFTSS